MYLRRRGDAIDSVDLIEGWTAAPQNARAVEDELRAAARRYGTISGNGNAVPHH